MQFSETLVKISKFNFRLVTDISQLHFFTIHPNFLGKKYHTIPSLWCVDRAIS